MDSANDSQKILMESLFGNFDQESPKILSFWQMTHERFESQKDDSISALILRNEESAKVSVALARKRQIRTVAGK